MGHIGRCADFTFTQSFSKVGKLKSNEHTTFTFSLSIKGKLLVLNVRKLLIRCGSKDNKKIVMLKFTADTKGHFRVHVSGLELIASVARSLFA